ncbi:MAG: hypothetical protein AMJ53_11725, partial [Gammaproteobacteria bacterium SG8_11]
MPIQHIKHILINALLLAALTPLPVWSGELHDFEHDVTKSDENKPHPNRNTHARRSSQESEPPSQTAEDDSDCDGLFSCFLELILSDAVNAIVSGIGKAATSNSGALQKPDVKFSLMTQKVAPDIVGTRYKFALDYATASLYGEATQYKEDDPKDSLQLMNAMFMQRIPLSRRLRSGLGLGI